MLCAHSKTQVVLMREEDGDMHVDILEILRSQRTSWMEGSHG